MGNLLVPPSFFSFLSLAVVTFATRTTAMKPLYSLFTPSILLHQSKILLSLLFSTVQTFLFSLPSYVALGLFSASVVALLTHKLTIILLHRPLGWNFIILWPFLFGLDLTTLVVLHHALASCSRVVRILGMIIGVVIISCSATFVSIVLETNAPANWGRSIEVHRVWKN